MSGAGKRVLITGLEGFTGRYMAAEMKADGYEVIGLGRQPSSENGYVQADLTDGALLKLVMAKLQPDIVIHLAALAFVGHGDANAFYQVNLIGTRNLLEALADCGKVPHVVLLASSANVYGNTSSGILSESALPAPANDYAVSKFAMEQMANLWMSRLPIIITRPFNYTGVGQGENFLLPKIVSHFRRRLAKIELGNLDVWRDFSDVRSLVRAYRLLIKHGAVDQPVNVCSGRTHSLREVIGMCEDITDHKIEVQVNPAFVRSGEVKMLCGDATRLRQLIGGWETQPLEVTLRWMLKQG